jgi:hypothetical protein
VTAEVAVLRCPHPYPRCEEMWPAGDVTAAQDALCLHLQDRHNWEHGTARRLADGAAPVVMVRMEGGELPLLDGPQPDAGQRSARQPTRWRDAPGGV